MADMLGDPEMSTLRDMVKDTDHKKGLDKRSHKVLAFYQKEIRDYCNANI